MDQFIATFHRFCGDDQTFFVATMTSRPIGLETAFSIQLADKQPVLRGMCIVLDAWDTPDNRYKRPGIRLGIKRLTADSQPVFDRLKAAAKSPTALVEGTPAPGPPPVPLPSIASSPSVSPPAFALRLTSPPPLPSLIVPRTGGMRATTQTPPEALRPPAIGFTRQGLEFDLPAHPATELKPIDAGPGAAKPVDVKAFEPRPGAAKPVDVKAFEPRPGAAKPVDVKAFEPRPGAAKPADEKPADAKVVFAPRPVEPRSSAETRPHGAPAFASRPMAAKPLDPRPPSPAPSPAPSQAEAAASPVKPAVDARPSASPIDAAFDRAFPSPAKAVDAAADAIARDPAASQAPVPIEVTRFQVALHVDTAPPPVDDVEFKPTQLAPRPRIEPRFVGDPAADEAAGDPAMPALIVDRPSAPEPPLAQQAAASVTTGEQARSADPAPAPGLRTPGSALVLPANPLHDLSDESLEGFVDCTLYEESGSVFHPLGDGGDWNDDDAAPPAPPPAQARSSTTVPAMPFDTPPNLMVRSLGNTESLALAPDEPVGTARAFDSPAMSPPFAPHDQRAAGVAPESPPTFAAHGEVPASGRVSLQVPFGPAHAAPGASAPVWLDGASTPYPSAPHAGPQSSSYAAYPSDATAYPHHATPPPMLAPPPDRALAGWRRWAVIAGTAVAAIVVAFAIARGVRGSAPAAPATVAGNRADAAQRVASPPAAPPAQTGSPTPAAAGALDRKGNDAGDPASAGSGDSASPEDDGAGGRPIVGRGPCQLTVATTPAGSIIRLDEVAVGPSPLTIASTCEKHRIDVSHARYQSQAKWVTLAADKPQELDVTLVRPTHAVTVTSFPPGAELSIDGRRAGTTPTVVQMMGFATVNLTFTKPGFQSVTKKVYSKVAQDRVFVKLMR